MSEPRKDACPCCDGSTPLAYGTTVRYDSDGRTEAKLTCGKGHRFRVFVGEPSQLEYQGGGPPGCPVGTRFPCDPVAFGTRRA